MSSIAYQHPQRSFVPKGKGNSEQQVQAAVERFPPYMSDEKKKYTGFRKFL